MIDKLICLRGEIIPQSRACVSVLSPTAQFGLNVFEGIRCYWNEAAGELYAFRVKEHIARLMLSCKVARLPSPYDPEQIEEFMLECIKANRFYTDIALRMTIFGDGEGSWSSVGPVSMFIAPIEKKRTSLDNIPALKACISSWERINDNVLPPRIKMGANYLNGRYAHLQAMEDGYDLPIFLGSDGKVAEGAGACLFMIRNGCLVTPSKTSSILESITRDTIIVLAREANIEVHERSIDRTELYLADEIFLCGTAAEVTPIVAVDRYIVGAGVPGPITISLLKDYLAIVSGESSAHNEWRTVVNRRV